MNRDGKPSSRQFPNRGELPFTAARSSRGLQRTRCPDADTNASGSKSNGPDKFRAGLRADSPQNALPTHNRILPTPSRREKGEKKRGGRKTAQTYTPVGNRIAVVTLRTIQRPPPSNLPPKKPPHAEDSMLGDWPQLELKARKTRRAGKLPANRSVRCNAPKGREGTHRAPTQIPYNQQTMTSIVHFQKNVKTRISQACSTCQQCFFAFAGKVVCGPILSDGPFLTEPNSRAPEKALNVPGRPTDQSA